MYITCIFSLSLSLHIYIYVPAAHFLLHIPEYVGTTAGAYSKRCWLAERAADGVDGCCGGQPEFHKQSVAIGNSQ